MKCRGVELGEVLSPKVFKALGDPRRVAILDQLARQGGEACVSDVASCCDVDVSVVSRHLATLKAAGILEAQRHGRQIRYRLRARELAALLREMADALETCCGD